MSYILDALRKSETERRQGKVPDLGQQVHLIHRPKKRRVSPVLWVALALLVNAGVLAVVFWPEMATDKPAPTEPEIKPAEIEPRPVADPSPVQPEPVSEPTAEPVRERPAIIRPSVRQERPAPPVSDGRPEGRVPHLVELPLSFQKSVPDLMFNSHIFSTDPSASRVMINGHYLRPGESFSGITVEEVTEDGVVLSKQGERFRVGTVRDWVSPR
ncbi:GspB domain-containing protein [Marinobacter adhaerens]|uniref:GspB domain-containing protein n=1 Tax=Marinobacter adhaerens TaxID=1033846 RepID=A0A851HSK7_9GAMM|nr:general secretion pathway protein GspB [Marinobacter adhaerens]NWN90456.1 GspB domain-containing protein [Marinobacter adhaerens]